MKRKHHLATGGSSHAPRSDRVAARVCRMFPSIMWQGIFHALHDCVVSGNICYYPKKIFKKSKD